MTIKKAIAVVFLGMLVILPAAFGEPGAVSIQGLEPLQQSAAFKQYKKRPKTELSKLVFLLDRFKGMPAEVIYDGQHYDCEFAIKTAKTYMAKHYKKNQSAEAWIRENAYRSDPARQLILFKAPTGETEPLRDVLLAELEKLKKF